MLSPGNNENHRLHLGLDIKIFQIIFFVGANNPPYNNSICVTSCDYRNQIILIILFCNLFHVT